MNKKLKIGIGISAALLATTIPLVALTHNSCSSNIENISQTNIVNEAQQYANDNSVSLGFAFQPSVGVLRQIKNFFEIYDYDLNLEQRIMDDIVNNMNPNQMSLLFGTAWMIDCKQGINNLNTYYLATNTHVLDLSLTLNGQFQYYAQTYEYEFNFPVNAQNVNFINLYMSQPQGRTNSSNGYNASYETLQTNWYKTNINTDNITNSIIQYNNYKGNNDYINFSFNLKQNKNQISVLVKDNYQLTSVAEQIKNNPTNFGLDSSILKLELNPNTIKPNRYTSKDARVQFDKMRKMFSIDEKYVDKNSNYISKLKRTYLDVTSNVVNNYVDSEYFPFQLSDTKVQKPITVGGFPGNNQKQYTYFNTATTDDINFHQRINRPFIRVLINGKFIYLNYKTADTGFLKGVDLKHGSSGSMVLDNNHKIVGIYWGAFVTGTYGLFVPFNINKSTLWRGLTNFIKSNQEFENSMLGQLLRFNQAVNN